MSGLIIKYKGGRINPQRKVEGFKKLKTRPVRKFPVLDKIFERFRET